MVTLPFIPGKMFQSTVLGNILICITVLFIGGKETCIFYKFGDTIAPEGEERGHKFTLKVEVVRSTHCIDLTGGHDAVQIFCLFIVLYKGV